MRYMLCYNKVKDYKKWREIFNLHKNEHIKAGLILTSIYRDTSNPNEIHFIFEIEDIEKANEFLSDPIHEKIGLEAGVIEGTIKYLDEVGGY